MITLVPLSGFLGSGKTTTLISAAIAMQRTGRRVAVITNDPGSRLVDTELARAGLGDVVEVSGGCYCVCYQELSDQVAALADSGRVDTVLIEATGACPDVRPALGPLMRDHGDKVAIAPLTAVVDPVRLGAFDRAADRSGRDYELSYIFDRQVAAADLIAINKADLIGAERAAKLEARLAADHPHATVVPYSAVTGAGLEELVRVWSRDTVTAEREFAFAYDYPRYTHAEAKLAWANHAFGIKAMNETFDALVWGRTVLRYLSEWSAVSGYFVGHAKVAVRTPAGLAKLSLTETGATPRADRAAARPVDRGSATLNVRVACSTSALDEALTGAIKAADAFSHARSDGGPPASFQATQPLPPHLKRAAANGHAPY